MVWYQTILICVAFERWGLTPRKHRQYCTVCWHCAELYCNVVVSRVVVGLTHGVAVLSANSHCTCTCINVILTGVYYVLQVVTGATGRVGALAVRRLLELYPRVLVRAIVNDFAKGSRLLKEEKDDYGIKLEVHRDAHSSGAVWSPWASFALAGMS